MTVRAIPEGYNTVNAYLVVQGAAEAIDFYTRALGAEERYRLPGPDGSVMHAELEIGDSVVMLADESPQMGALSPQSVGGSPVSLLVYTEDVDAAFQRAVDAGATGTAPPEDMFWGDRCGRLVDPFGHVWALGRWRRTSKT
jgi:PhnB protein